MTDRSFVHAIFLDEVSAVRAAEALIDAKFPTHDIGALMRGPVDADVEEELKDEIPIKHTTGIPAGALLGGVLGALGGVAIASGAVLAAGPLMIALEGAVAGGAFGTLAGALAGLAHWHETIRFPLHTFDRGGVLLGVTTHPARIDEARAALALAGGDDIRVSTKAEARRAAHDVSSATQRS